MIIDELELRLELQDEIEQIITRLFTRLFLQNAKKTDSQGVGQSHIQKPVFPMF